MNPPAHIHVSCPSGGEIHVGPFDSIADASCYMANYPAEIRNVCTVSDSHPLVGTVFAPDVEWVNKIMKSNTEIPEVLKTAAQSVHNAKSKAAKTIKRREFVRQCHEAGLSAPWVMARLVAHDAEWANEII